jgi:hypothetical protein
MRASEDRSEALALAFLLGVLVEPLLNGFENVLRLPAGDPALDP